jgi:hypothetical protein
MGGRHAYLPKGPSKYSYEILRTKKLGTCDNDDLNIYKIWLASDRKPISKRRLEWKKRPYNEKRGIEKGDLVLEIW